jgi:KDO2-lipid IV(A) lauroyltransferase
MSARHQRRVTGRADPAAVHGVFQWYGRYWLEILRLPADVRNGSVDPNFTIEGYEHITDALAKGKGAILALPHLGGWEWAGFWVAAVAGLPISVVVESLEPPELFEWFAGLRRSLGMHIVPLDKDAGSVVMRELRANHVVCLLCDRDLGGGGTEVTFFGERTRLPGGPATLALRTGAALIPCATYFEGRQHMVEVHAPMKVEREGRLRDDVARITQDLANHLETLIRVAPEQWHLLQPNWPSDLP